MSDTPRTDDYQFIGSSGHPLCHADHARRLERELTAMTKRAEKAEQERDEARAAVRELITVSRIAMGIIATSPVATEVFEERLREAGVTDGFGVRAQQAAGIFLIGRGIGGGR